MKLNSENRAEFNLGWRTSNNVSAMKLNGLYQWVWPLEQGFNWYAGVGAGVIKGDYEVNFPLKLMLKDARLIQAFAKRFKSPVSIATTTEELAKEGVDSGYGELNASAIVKVIAKRAGVDLVE